MKRSLSLATAGIAVTGALVLAGGTGVAIGAAVRPVDGQGKINACVKADNGAIRIANSSSDCKPAELPLAWDQQATSAAGRLNVYKDGELLGPLTSSTGPTDTWYLGSDGQVARAYTPPVYRDVPQRWYLTSDCSGPAYVYEQEQVPNEFFTTGEDYFHLGQTSDAAVPNLWADYGTCQQQTFWDYPPTMPLRELVPATAPAAPVVSIK